MKVFPPERLIQFLHNYGRTVSAISVARKEARHRYKTVSKFYTPADFDIDAIANAVCELVAEDLRKIDSADGVYRVTTTHTKGLKRANHFMFSLVEDGPPENRVDCSECGGSGEYIGFTERSPCHVCEGRRWIVP